MQSMHITVGVADCCAECQVAEEDVERWSLRTNRCDPMEHSDTIQTTELVWTPHSTRWKYSSQNCAEKRTATCRSSKRPPTNYLDICDDKTVWVDGNDVEESWGSSYGPELVAWHYYMMYFTIRKNVYDDDTRDYCTVSFSVLQWFGRLLQYSFSQLCCNDPVYLF